MNKQRRDNILEEFYRLALEALEAHNVITEFFENDSPSLDQLDEAIRLIERQELTAMRLADFCWANKQAMMEQFHEAVRIVRGAPSEA